MAALEDWICTVCAVESEEEARWLAPIVGEQKIRGGGEAAPVAANGAAAENILDRKTDKDLRH
jgi:hypothetical protein